jgi:hypothetical protein
MNCSLFAALEARDWTKIDARSELGRNEVARLVLRAMTTLLRVSEVSMVYTGSANGLRASRARSEVSGIESAHTAISEPNPSYTSTNHLLPTKPLLTTEISVYRESSTTPTAYGQEPILNRPTVEPMVVYQLLRTPCCVIDLEGLSTAYLYPRLVECGGLRGTRQAS